MNQETKLELYVKHHFAKNLFNNIKNRLAKKDNQIIVEPFIDNDDLREIYIFDVETIEEAQTLSVTDPVILKKSLVMELHK